MKTYLIEQALKEDELLYKLARKANLEPDQLRKEYELYIKIEDAKHDLSRLQEVADLTQQLIQVQRQNEQPR